MLYCIHRVIETGYIRSLSQYIVGTNNTDERIVNTESMFKYMDVKDICFDLTYLCFHLIQSRFKILSFLCEWLIFLK